MAPSRDLREEISSLRTAVEDLGEWHRSFECLSSGAAARRQRMRYSVDADIDTMLMWDVRPGATE